MLVIATMYTCGLSAASATADYRYGIKHVVYARGAGKGAKS